MATPFIPLPPDAFPEAARPSIERLNVFLLELSRLEGTIRQPIQSRRSDQSVARRGAVQVDISRITPSVASVVSGISTVVATPAITFGLTNVVGSSTSAVSINSAIALFNTNAPPAVDASAGVAGLSSTAANLGHRHQVSTAAPTIGYTTTAGLTGSATTLVRSDATLLAPTFLRSSANNFTLALTDNGSDPTLTGSTGILTLAPADGLRVSLPSSATAQVVIAPPSSGTAAATVVSVQGRPVQGTRTLMSPNWFQPETTDVFSAQTFRTWDVVMNLVGQHASSTFVGYDASSSGAGLSSGSSLTNNLYVFRAQPLIGTGNGGFVDAATAYFRGPRRSITSYRADTLASVIIEPPTGCNLKTDGVTPADQIGILIRQQAAQGTAPTNRAAIWVDAQNTGTNRYAFYGVSDILYHGGDIQHAGRLIGLYNVGTGATQSVGWSVSNITATKTLNGSSFTLNDVMNTLGTLLTYLQVRGDVAA